MNKLFSAFTLPSEKQKLLIHIFSLLFHTLVSTADVVTFKDLVKMRKIPSKERVVALKGVPLEHSEKHIRALFNGKLTFFIHHLDDSHQQFLFQIS